MFQTVHLSIIRSFSLDTQQSYMSNKFADSLRSRSGRNWFRPDPVRKLVPSWSCSQAVNKPVWLIRLLCVQWKTPDDGQRKCLKHVMFYSKNKFQKLMHLVGLIIRIYRDPRHMNFKFVMYVLLSSTWNNWPLTGTIFMKFHIWVFFKILLCTFRFN